MFHGEMLFPVVGQVLVELAVLFLADVVRVARPQWFGLVQLFVLCVLLFDRLLLFLLLLGFVCVGVLSFIFQFGCFVLFFLFTFFLLFLLLVFTEFLFSFFLDEKFDRIANELRGVLDHLLHFLLLVVLHLVFLHVEHNLRTPSERLSRVRPDGERTSRRRFPHVLLVVVVF
uniref:Uncharacterized protein n=1 Tax=Cacopsylla melanoneura TaxID=428564 RepID=A0A8D8T5T0_9HEMI